MQRSIAARMAVCIAAGSVLLAGSIVLAAALGVDALDVSSPAFDVRLPRVVLGAIAGVALGAVGASLQALLRNPLADPYVLGTSGGAALGGTLALALGTPVALAAIVLPLAAFAGALAATLLVWMIARLSGGATLTSVLLAGVVVNAFASAAITLVKILVTATQAQEVLLWLVGFIGYERWSTIAGVSAYAAVGVVVLVALSGRMNLLSLGDESAAHLGVDVPRVQWAIFIATALVVGAVVALCGLIGFVGLVVPHAVRLVVGPDHRLVVTGSALAGGAFLVLADLGARLLFDALGTEPPVGAITALVGCPVFLWLLVRHRGYVSA